MLGDVSDVPVNCRTDRLGRGNFPELRANCHAGTHVALTPQRTEPSYHSITCATSAALRASEKGRGHFLPAFLAGFLKLPLTIRGVVPVIVAAKCPAVGHGDRNPGQCQPCHLGLLTSSRADVAAVLWPA